MSDTATNNVSVPNAAVPAATVTAADATPGKEAPKTVTVADLKAARRTEPAKPGDQQPETDKSKDPVQAKTDPAKPEADKTLETFKSLRKELEEKSARLAEAEAAMTEAQIVRKAKELAKQGKNYEAIKLLELDFDAAAREVMGLEPEQASEKDAEIEALKAKLAELEGKANELVKSKEELDAERLRQTKEQGLKAIKDHVKASKDKFPFLSRSDSWIEHALKGADEAYLKIRADRDKAGKPDLTPEEKEKLIDTALTEGEAMRAEEAKLYGVTGQTQEQPSNGAGITSDIRRGTVRPPVKQPSGKSIEDLKRARRQARN